MKKLFCLTVVMFWTMAFACTAPPVERSAYNVVVAAKAFLDKEKVDHPECAATPNTTICSDLSKAVGAKDALIDAITVYCAGPQFNTGGACNPPAKGTPAYDQAVAKVNQAIASYNTIAADLKVATGGS